MKTIRHPAALSAALTCLLALPAAAFGEGSSTTTPVTTTAPVPAPVTTTAPATTPAPPASPGRIKLSLQRVGGKPLFAAVGSRIIVRGVVTPYVAGQSIKLSFFREGRRISTGTVAVQPVGNGAGQFHVGFSSADAGLVQVRAAHVGTAAQLAFTGSSPSVHFVHENLGLGSSGASVRVLQAELAELHFVVPQNGIFDEATGRALVAYRKMTGLERTEYSGSEVFSRLSQGAGVFHVRYRGDGKHVEADLTKQVLVEINPGGKVRAIYTMSSGKPSTPTVLGRFRVYRKEPGTNSEGMVESSYFISGYAIHGYHEVPTYAASHGCLRVPIPNAPEIYRWVGEGTPVDVYN